MAQWSRIRLPMLELQNMWVCSLGWGDPLVEERAVHSSILAWEIPWPEEYSGLHSTRGHKESDATERLSIHTQCFSD